MTQRTEKQLENEGREKVLERGTYQVWEKPDGEFVVREKGSGTVNVVDMTWNRKEIVARIWSLEQKLSALEATVATLQAGGR